MSSLKVFVAALSLAAFCGPAAIAEAPADGAAPHAWHKPSPQEMAAWHARMCNDHYARQAGRLAYLEASLSITDAQRGAFDQWRGAVLSAAKSRSQECLAHTMTPGHMPDALERSAHMQKRLEARLAMLRTEQPALEAFYQSLSPEQKKMFDMDTAHFGHRGGHHFGERFGERHDGEHHDGEEHPEHG